MHIKIHDFVLVEHECFCSVHIHDQTMASFGGQDKRNRVEGRNKLRTYAEFKTEYVVES